MANKYVDHGLYGACTFTGCIDNQALSHAMPGTYSGVAGSTLTVATITGNGRIGLGSVFSYGGNTYYVSAVGTVLSTGGLGSYTITNVTGAAASLAVSAATLGTVNATFGNPLNGNGAAGSPADSILAWGVAQEGDGTALGAATPSIGSLAFSSVPTTGTISVFGASVSTTGVIGAATASAAADVLANNINATTNTVSTGGFNGSPQLRNVVYARGPSNGAPAGTCQVMTRAGSASFNGTTWITTSFDGSPTNTAFAGGAGGAWGYLWNAIGTMWPSAIACGGYGVWAATQPYVGSLAAGDICYVRSAKAIPVNPGNGTFSPAIPAMGSASSPVTFIIDNNSVWADGANTQVRATYYGTNFCSPYFANASAYANVVGNVFTPATFTGSITSNVLTVSAISAGTIAVGSRVNSVGGSSIVNAIITAQLTGSAGGTGTYQLLTTPNAASTSCMSSLNSLAFELNTTSGTAYVQLNIGMPGRISGVSLMSMSNAGTGNCVIYNGVSTGGTTAPHAGTLKDAYVRQTSTGIFLNANAGNYNRLVFQNLECDNGSATNPNLGILGYNGMIGGITMDGCKFSNFAVGSKFINALGTGGNKLIVRNQNWGSGVTLRGGPNTANFFTQAMPGSPAAFPFEKSIFAYSQLGARDFMIDTPHGYLEWNSTLSFPYLNALLLDGVTPWVWHFVPSPNAGNIDRMTPFELPRIGKINSLASGARTITVEFCLEKTLAWTAADVSVAVEYTDVNGNLITLDTFDYLAGALTASTTTWTGMGVDPADSVNRVVWNSSGNIYHNRYKFVVSTPSGNNMANGSDIGVFFRIHTTTPASTKGGFVDPDFSVA